MPRNLALSWEAPILFDIVFRKLLERSRTFSLIELVTKESKAAFKNREYGLLVISQNSQRCSPDSTSLAKPSSRSAC
ncbi:hypothetical protein PG988_009672 [Apiospora saccharicola]